MRLTWQRDGMGRCTCVGMRRTSDGVLRPLTEDDVARIEREFKRRPGEVVAFEVLPWESEARMLERERKALEEEG